MPAKPTLGYATKTLAILALAAKGMDPHDIAEKVDAEVQAVRARLIEAKRKKPAATAPKKPIEVAKRARQRRLRDHDDRPCRPVEDVPLNEDVKKALRSHARRRDMTVVSLAQLILETVVDGKLVDAVLDDRGDG